MIAGEMATTPNSTPAREPLRRAPSGFGPGVCEGLGRHLGIDPLVVRIAFIATATVGGLGIVLYLVAWVAIPAERAEGARRRQWPTGRGAIEVAVGMGLIVVSLLLTARALGVLFSDAVAWPTVLLAAGGA